MFKKPGMVRGWPESMPKKYMINAAKKKSRWSEPGDQGKYAAEADDGKERCFNGHVKFEFRKIVDASNKKYFDKKSPTAIPVASAASPMMMFSVKIKRCTCLRVAPSAAHNPNSWDRVFKKIPTE